MFDILAQLPFLQRLDYASHKYEVVKDMLLSEHQYQSLLKEIHKVATQLHGFEIFKNIFTSLETLKDAYSEHFFAHYIHVPSLIKKLDKFAEEIDRLRKKYSEVSGFMDATVGVFDEVGHFREQLQRIHSINKTILTNVRAEIKEIFVMFYSTGRHGTMFIKEYNHYLECGDIKFLLRLLNYGQQAWLAIENINKIIETPTTPVKRLMADMLRDRLGPHLVGQSWMEGLHDFHPDRHASWLTLLFKRVIDSRNTASSGNSELPSERPLKRKRETALVSDEERTNKSKEIFSEYQGNVHHLQTFITRIDSLVTIMRSSIVITSELLH